MKSLTTCRLFALIFFVFTFITLLPEDRPSAMLAAASIAPEPFAPAGYLFNIFTPNAHELVVGPYDQLAIVGTQNDYVKTSLSYDKGFTWRQAEDGFMDFDISTIIFSPDKLNSQILAGLDFSTSKLLISNDKGFTWQESSNYTSSPEQIVYSPTYQLDKSIYLRSSDKLYVSTNEGKNWALLSTIGNPTVHMALAPNFNQSSLILVARQYDGVRRSIDKGNSWVTYQTGLDLSAGNQVQKIIFSPYFANDNKIFAITLFGVYQSTDKGQSWQNIWPYIIKDIKFHPLYGKSNQTFFLIAETTIAGNSEDALFKTTDNGNSFQGLIGYVRDFEFSWDYIDNQTIYALTDYGLVQSMDNGTTWYINSPMYPDLSLQQVIASPTYDIDGTMFALLKGYTDNDTDYRIWRVINSNSSGYSVTNLTIPEKENGQAVIGVSPNYANDRTIFYLTGNYTTPGKLFKSVDAGQNWAVVNGNLPIEINWRELDIEFSPNFAADQTLFMSNYLNGVYKSTNGGQTWQHLYVREGVTSIALSSGYPVDSRLFLTHVIDGIMLSLNGGTQWNPITTPEVQNEYKIAISPDFPQDDTLFAIGGSVWRSTDSGTSWIEINNGVLDYNTISAIQVSPNFKNDQTLILQQQRTGMLWTENAGDNWYEVNGMTLSWNNPGLAALPYWQGRPFPISVGRDGVYFYEWPVVNAAFGCNTITLDNDILQNARLSVTSSTPLPIKWRATDGGWFTFVESSGTWPEQPQMQINTNTIVSPIKEEAVVDIFLSYRQSSPDTATVFAPCMSTNLPLIMRQ